MKRYSIIYCDPPWPYDNNRSGRVKDGAYTYPAMSIAQLCALPVPFLAARDCCLFLWATMPKLQEAFTVIRAWGFRYTTCAFVWVKQNPKGEGIYSGLGHWTNQNAELCLLAKRGKPRRLAKNVKQVILAPRGRHSEKPKEVRERVVNLLGDLPRIELFARQRVPGWDAWGNEVESDICLVNGHFLRRMKGAA